MNNKVALRTARKFCLAFVLTYLLFGAILSVEPGPTSNFFQNILKGIGVQSPNAFIIAQPSISNLALGLAEVASFGFVTGLIFSARLLLRKKRKVCPNDFEENRNFACTIKL